MLTCTPRWNMAQRAQTPHEIRTKHYRQEHIAKACCTARFICPRHPLGCLHSRHGRLPHTRPDVSACPSCAGYPKYCRDTHGMRRLGGRNSNDLQEMFLGRHTNTRCAPYPEQSVAVSHFNHHRPLTVLPHTTVQQPQPTAPAVGVCT